MDSISNAPLLCALGASLTLAAVSQVEADSAPPMPRGETSDHYTAGSGDGSDSEAPGLLVLDAEFLDTSMQSEIFGEDPAEQARLAMISDIVREGARQSPRYRLVPLPKDYAPLQALSSQVRFLHDCNDCELGLARSLGADLVATIWVQKVSNLIINLNVVIKDADDGTVVRTAFVDIRGNTDASWRRGAEYMVEHRLTGAD